MAIRSWSNLAALLCRQRGALLLLLAGVLGAGVPVPDTPDPDLQRYSYSQIHMGLRVRMVLYAQADTVAQEAARAAFRKIVALEDILSHYHTTSELMRLCRQAGGPPVRVSRPLFTVLEEAQELARRSGGAFDVTVGPYVALWREARETRRLPSAQALRKAGTRVGWRKVKLNANERKVQLLRPGMELDLGGLAKGYILEQALEVLAAQGAARALVEAGGDLVVSGAPPGRAGWRVEVPGAAPGGAVRTLVLTHAAVSTSGDTMQFVEIGGTRYSHVVDPRTGLGLTEHVAVTVVAPNGMTADGLATTIGILGEEEARALLDAYPQATAYIHPASERASAAPE